MILKWFIPQDSSIDKLAINTDSQFMINCMEQWIQGWKRKGWKTAKGEPGAIHFFLLLLSLSLSFSYLSLSFYLCVSFSNFFLLVFLISLFLPFSSLIYSTILEPFFTFPVFYSHQQGGASRAWLSPLFRLRERPLGPRPRPLRARGKRGRRPTGQGRRKEGQMM